MMRRVFAMKCVLMAVIAMGWFNAASANTADTAAFAAIPEIVLQIGYCCKMQAECINVSKSNRANETPCACRSHLYARVKDAVFTDSFRWHLSIMSLLLHQYPLRVQTQSTLPAAVHSFGNKSQLHILNACLLI
jgi:hypothetical protein